MSQGAMSVSWAHPDVSSISVRIGRRWFVTNVSPTAAASFMNHARLASIDIHSVTSRALNAQASTTCVPWVLTTLIRWAALTRAALPRPAGIVTSPVLTAPPRSSHGRPRCPRAARACPGRGAQAPPPTCPRRDRRGARGAPPAVGGAAVRDAVAGDRPHRPEVRQAGPEPVEGRQMRPVELARARGPEALSWISEVPDVEVRHLRPLDGDDAEELTGPHGPGPARTPGDDEPLDEPSPAGLAREGPVELAVDLEGRARLGRVDHARSRHVLTSSRHG